MSMRVVPDTSRQKTVQILEKKWCGLNNESKRMIVLFEELEELTPIQITFLINRYISLTESLHKRTLFFAIQFHMGRTIITVGSIFVSALLSVQYIKINNSGDTPSQNGPSVVFWLTWFISLLVTICNGILTLFKVDKKYYFLHTTLEQFKSEVWQFLNLTGKYGGHYTRGSIPSHHNQYVFFCHNLEKIKLKQIEEEYYKLIDTNEVTDKEKKPSQLLSTKSFYKDGTSESGDNSIAGLYIPTPEQIELLNHQKELANALIQNGSDLNSLVDGRVKETTTKVPVPGQGPGPAPGPEPGP